MIKQKSSGTRKGTVIIAVLVCMTVAVSILLGAMHSSLTLRRQSRLELQMEQTRQLLDAGVRRALKRLKEKPAYVGETVPLSSVLASYPEAEVKIEVVRGESSPGKVEIRVAAQLHRTGELTPTTKRSKKLIVNLY